jgi:hypothetical protein
MRRLILLFGLITQLTLGQVTRYIGYNEILIAQGHYYNETHFVTEIVLGTHAHPYSDSLKISFVTSKNDTIKVEDICIDWLKTNMTERIFSPKRDTFSIEERPFKHKVYTTIGGKPKRYYSWKTDSVQIFNNDCWGVEIITQRQKIVSIYLYPSQFQVDEQNTRQKENLCIQLKGKQIKFSQGVMKPYYDLPCTEAALIELFGTPQKKYNLFEYKGMR